jgi:DNA-binding NarL/FixJ family response regulator
LSRREVDVFDLLVDGFRVPIIADKLCISTHTVRNHLKSMYRKLGVHSQSELIALVRSNESEA